MEMGDRSPRPLALIVSNSEGKLSPSEKRAARDATRRALRARKRDLGQAFRADWDDRDADTSNWLDAALDADAGSHMTPQLLFSLASRAMAELADATGTDREDVLQPILR
jgi:hypothetical protein